MQQSLSGKSAESLSQANLEDIQKVSVRPRNYRAILTIMKLFAGLALLMLSVRGIQFEALFVGIRTVDLTWLILSILMVILGLGLKLWRWHILVRNYHIYASFSRLFSAYFVGQAANIVFPLRGGELVRLGYFSEGKKILPEAASTIVLEKYLDLLALTVCCIIVSLQISLDNVLNMRGYLLPITITATLLLLLAILFGPNLWEKIRECNFLSQPMVSWLNRWVMASQWLTNPKEMIPGLFLTIFIWLAMWVTNLLLFRSLGLSLGATAGGLVLVLVYIGLLPALMPGNIGPFYFFASLALLPFGILYNQAVSYAVLLHATVTFPPLLAGAIGLLIHSHPPSIA